uniref:ABC transporter domain-containing protein n=1 Tax=Oryza barthii TaxID=65489 RepID=A0A0D3H5G1_9ORYZ
MDDAGEICSFSRSSSPAREDDEEDLRWAALEKLPTYDRARTALLAMPDGELREVNVQRLTAEERRALRCSAPPASPTTMHASSPSSKNVVGIKLPTVEVRYENLNMEAESYVGRRGLPTILNTYTIIMENDPVVRPSRFRKNITIIGLGWNINLKDLLMELLRREKEQNIKPDPEIDIYLKAATTGEQKAEVVTDHILKILGLDICADTIVGNNMLRGISGGQKKRLTTAEMIVTPGRALFMDEISTGLDSSTTFQIVNTIRQTIRILGGTAIIALLQPAPETYELFDDIIVLSDGQVVYNGPRDHVLEFFKSVGFKCLERKCVADFLQEVTSRKDQKQYWIGSDDTYQYVPVTMIAEAFQSFHVGQAIKSELAIPFEKSKNHPAALATSKYGVSMKELLKANIYREILLMKRNSFLYIFKAIQLTLVAINAMTVFIRTNMYRDSIENGRSYMGALFYGMMMIVYSALAEMGPAIAKLPVLFKQRDLLYYPSWTYSLPSWIIKIPISFPNTTVWVFLTYYVIGFDPNALRHPVLASNMGPFYILIFMLSCGFILTRDAKEIINDAANSYHATRHSSAGNKGMVLPFVPLSITFEDIRYSVDMPEAFKAKGMTEGRLELLKDISGSFRQGVLTALMGVSGAGKTTLLDVLAGRKTSGYVQGSITISGYPKKQETFARISGYCEQNDIHSPNVTVYESLIFSALLRLPVEIDSATRKSWSWWRFSLKDALVGLPGVSGLSSEQRKRLTIAVELVANPSIIFMDEPTSGLDAQAAAIVMRAVRNTVDTRRIVVCTIHQPSIEIFESFDELFLMKQGGEEIYVGPIGQQSCELIRYFEAIQGVSKIKDGYNPSTWMLEVTSTTQEQRTCVDFSQIHKNSELYRRNKNLIKELSAPPDGSSDLSFPTQYSQLFLTQWLACLWKQHLSQNQQTLLSIMGAMYSVCMAMGVQNSSSVQPAIFVERTVFYRERASHMYSALSYALGQTIIYCVLVYAMVGYEWTCAKFLWYLFFMFFTLSCFTFYGMMVVGLTPNNAMSAVVSTAFYNIWNLSSRFLIPRIRIPVWWRWYYWMCPVAWTLNGLLTSQFGDVNDKFNNGVSVSDFIESYFGYQHDLLWVAAVAVVSFAILFAFLFGLSLRLFNFQKR